MMYAGIRMTQTLSPQVKKGTQPLKAEIVIILLHDMLNLKLLGATNGAVVVWDLGRTSKAKQSYVFQDHERTVNRVTFHPHIVNYLLSGSQDGLIKLFDIRTNEAVSIFQSNSQSVRDVAFCPHGHGHLFAAALENGQIQLWDVRKSDRPERKWPAHSDPIFTVDWHPESRYINVKN